MTTGWHGESKRHSIAAKYGQAGSKTPISTLHSLPTIKTSLIREGNKLKLLDEQGNKLASLKVTYDTPTSLRIESWKAYKKGHGYGRELLRKLMQQYPDVVTIATEGFTKLGAANIVKVLPDFRIVEWRHGAAAGSGFLARQDLIDYYIEEDERQMKIRGREMRSPIFNFPKEWHSKYKTSEPTVVV